MRLQIFIECGGLDGEEHAELARKLKDEMANTRRLIASVKTLSPPAREKFNRLVEESQPEHDLLNEILKLRWDASISLAEVDEWNEATDAQQYELIRRKLFDLGMTDAEIEERIGVRKHRWENRSN
jgi:hypothetical protein